MLSRSPLIDGLQGLLGTGVTSFAGGNILLGGDGSDIIEGRGGNDIIDGDAWLNVRLSVRDALGNELVSANSMREIEPAMLAGTYNPGQIHIVREILTDRDAIPDTDTAVFSGLLADYTIGAADSQGHRTITDNRVGINDGVDVVRNIERLQFADQTVTLGNTNLAPVGAPTINDATPTEDQLLTASAAGVTDPDNPNGGLITGPGHLRLAGGAGPGQCPRGLHRYRRRGVQRDPPSVPATARSGWRCASR